MRKNPKFIAELLVFLISFIFYFVLFFLIKEQFFAVIFIIICVAFALSFYLTKAKHFHIKIVSAIAFLLAAVLNIRLMGWI